MKRAGVPTGRRSRLRLRDLVGEAGAAIGRRPGRSLLTTLGTVVGVGAFVATTGLASTARAQVGETFDALKATEVRVTDAAPDSDEPNPFPADTDERVAALNGVNVGGVLWTIDDPALDVRSTADMIVAANGWRWSAGPPPPS